MKYLCFGDLLSSQIVDLLVASGKLTASNLISAIDRKTSKSAVYRRLNELINSGVLIQYQSRFSVNPFWLDNYKQAAEKTSRGSRANYLLLGDITSSQIVALLASERKLTAGEIDSYLCLQYGTELSLSTIYRRLEKLIDNQVLVRRGARYSLNRKWINAFFCKAERIGESPQLSTVQLPLREGQYKIFSASSLIKLDPIWNLLQLEIISNSGGGHYVGYNAHAWHALTIENSERQVFQSMINRGAEVQLFYGNDSVLDDYGAESIKLDGFKSSIRNDLNLPKEGYSVWASSRFILECYFPDGLSREFAGHFQNIRNPDAFDHQIFLSLFKKRTTCTLKVWRSKKRASALQSALRSQITYG